MSFGNEVYITPECEVINLEMEDSVLITGSLGQGASHEGFGEEDWDGVWN